MLVVLVRCHLRSLCCVFYLQRWWNGGHWEECSEGYCSQLEEAASCAQVVKAMVNVGYSARASRALAAGLSKNSLLTEVELEWVPKELVESVQGTLCTNTALIVKVSDEYIW